MQQNFPKWNVFTRSAKYRVHSLDKNFAKPSYFSITEKFWGKIFYQIKIHMIKFLPMWAGGEIGENFLHNMYTVFIISVYNVMHTVSYRRLSKNITTEDTINYLNTQTDESKLIIHGNLFVSIYRQIILTMHMYLNWNEVHGFNWQEKSISGNKKIHTGWMDYGSTRTLKFLATAATCKWY